MTGGGGTRAVTLVTGGTGGIGAALVAALVAADRRVALTYHRDVDGAERLRAAFSDRVTAYALDLEDAEAPELLVQRVEQELGPIEALVNNAGVRAQGLLGMASDAEWTRVLETNLGGLFRCCRAVVPEMVRRRQGSIVNVLSLAALRGVAGQGSYAASKAGALGLTRVLAREVGRRGIRVNAIAPGFVPTAMTADLSDAEVARLRTGECLPWGVDVESVAHVVVFLLSPGARSITGQCIAVDAGASV